MRRLASVFVFFVLMSAGQIMAEISEKAGSLRVGPGLGFAFAGYREETDLPLNRYINTLTYSIDGTVEKGEFLHSFNIGFFTGKVKLPEINENDAYYTIYQKKTTFTRFYLQYALDYRLWGNQTFPGFLGGAIRGDIYYTSLKEAVDFSFTGVAAFNVHASQKWIINEKNTLIFSAGFPLLGYARRPPYFGLGHDLTAYEEKFISLHNYRAVFGDLRYYYAFNSLISLSSGLGFELSYFSFPQPRRDALFRLSAGIAFSF
jgi:hypothetical protein